MPRGGARIGAGRKPTKHQRFSVVQSEESVVEPVQESSASTSTSGVSLIAPEDMPSDQKAFWQEYAPLALERRTLTPATVPAFKLLCELEAEKRATKATIDRDGRTYLKVTVDGAGQEHEELKAHPLKADYAKLAKQVEALMARFTLAPFGKPAGSATSKTPAEAKKAAVRARFFGGALGA